MNASTERRAGELPGLGSRGTGLLQVLGWAALPALAPAFAAALARLGLGSAGSLVLGWALAATGPALLWLTTFVGHRWAAWPRFLAASAWALGIAAVAVRPEPLAALVALAAPLVVTAGALGWLSAPPRTGAAEAERARGRLVGAVVGAVLLWLLCLDAPTGHLATHAALAAGLASVAGVLGGTRRNILISLPFVVLVALPVSSPGALMVPGLLAFTVRLVREQSASGALGALLAEPARVMVGTFALAGVAGAALLALPEATESRAPLAFVDALFTAFSAVCVTGLGVVDTPTTFSAFGEAVILLLIQAGGLGIMTFSTAAVVLAGERLSLRHETAAVSLLKAEDQRQIKDLLRTTLRVTFAAEAVGALALSALFVVHGDGLGGAIWRGVFTSISAFCNAGFALQSDSLIGYQQSPAILLVIAGLIIAGGLGPVVMAALGGRRRLDLQARVVLAMSAALLVVGFVVAAAAEWSHTLKGMPVVDKLANAFFLSVTPRTAGFNAVDYAAVTPATFTLTLVLMFIGGSPGSTAGGIKTTTLAVLLMLVRQAFRGDRRAQAFGFSLKIEALRETVAVLVLSAVTVLGLLMALALTQAMTFEVALFESVSAVGTVGLSIGGTAQLDEVGKVLVALGMLAGRVGPLTLLLVVARRRGGPEWQPEGRLDVG